MHGQLIELVFWCQVDMGHNANLIGFNPKL